MASGYKIQALDPNNALAMAFNQLYATTNSGSSWVNITPNSEGPISDFVLKESKRHKGTRRLQSTENPKSLGKSETARRAASRSAFSES